MNASVKPQVEMLEDRLAMSGLQIADLTSVAIDPVSAAPVSGRITGIAVDPSDPSAERIGPFFHFEAHRLDPLGQGDGNVIYVATAGGGVWKTTDGGGGSYQGWGTWETNLSSASDDILSDGEPAAAGITSPDTEWRYVNVRRF